MAFVMASTRRTEPDGTSSRPITSRSRSPWGRYTLS